MSTPEIVIAFGLSVVIIGAFFLRKWSSNQKDE